MIGFAGGQVVVESLEVPVDDVGAAREPGPHDLLPVALKNV